MSIQYQPQREQKKMAGSDPAGGGGVRRLGGDQKPFPL